MSQKAQRLIVALEIKPKETRKLLNASKTIESMSRQGHYYALPASVVSPDQISWPTHFETTWAEEFVRSGTDVLSKVTQKLGVEFHGAPKVLTQMYKSRKLSAEAITDFAANEKASLLVLITHLNSNKSLLPFGGFAEATMNLSKVPVLAVNAKARPIKKIKTILFATDFDDESKSSFLRVLSVCKTLGAKVRIFHVLPQPAKPFVEPYSSVMFSPYEIASYLHNEELQLRQIADSWAAMAKRAHVGVQIAFDIGIGTTASRILRASHGAGNNRAEMIALSPQIGQIGAFFFGSTSRQVLRESKVPVLLIPSNENPKDVKNVENKRDQNRKLNDNEARNGRLLRAP